MSNTITSRPCQVNENGIQCDKDARAKCFHCSRDLCLIHLTEHSQLVEQRTRSSFHSHEQIVNDLHSKLNSLTISSRICESPLIQLEKWRTEAHLKLDQLAEQKREEIQMRIAEYRSIFVKKSNEQKQKIELIRKRLNDLSRQTHVANREMKNFEEKLDQIRSFLQSVEKHSIKVSAYDFFVNIRTHFFDNPSPRIPVSPPSTGSSTSSRPSRPETKEITIPSIKQRFDKKRSLSVCLL